MSTSQVTLPADFNQLPHTIPDLQMGPPMSASMQELFPPEEWRELMAFIERADMLTSAEEALTEEAWREVRALYDSLKERGNHTYCPVVQRALQLSLDPDLFMDALVLGNASGCFACFSEY